MQQISLLHYLLELLPVGQPERRLHAINDDIDARNA